MGGPALTPPQYAITLTADVNMKDYLPTAQKPMRL